MRAPPSRSGGSLLEIRNLTIRYREDDREITAVRDGLGFKTRAVPEIS
jgi:hypothetical protein